MVLGQLNIYTENMARPLPHIRPQKTISRPKCQRRTRKERITPGTWDWDFSNRPYKGLDIKENTGVFDYIETKN